MWRWSNSLNFLLVGDFGRTVQHVHSLCLPSCEFLVLTVSRLLNGATIAEWTAWHCQPSLTATLKTVFCCAFGYREYDKHRKDGASFHRFPANEEFRRRLLGSCSATARKLCKLIEEYNNGEGSTGQRSASGEKPKVSTHLLGETIRGRLVMSKKPLSTV